MSKQSQAKCTICQKDFAKSSMSRHIASCLKKHIAGNSASGKPQMYTHIVVTARYSTEYWLHLLVNSYDSLDTLDDFLRNIWLECCGHMSAFFYAHYDETR